MNHRETCRAKLRMRRLTRYWGDSPEAVQARADRDWAMFTEYRGDVYGPTQADLSRKYGLGIDSVKKIIGMLRMTHEHAAIAIDRRLQREQTH